MLKINVHLILRLAIGTVTAIAFALAPQLAHAQAPGALAQLASPNNCIQVTNGGSPDCETTGPGLLGSEDVAVSPDGKNAYVVGNGDDAISEFTRDDHGVLTWEGCIADANDTDPTSCSDNKTAAGLINPDAIAISPDGNNVYVTGFDSEGNGDVAEFARAAGGMLIQLSPDNCIAERSDSSSDCHDHDAQHALGLKGPAGIAVSPDGHNVYVADENGNAITTFSRASTGVLSQPDDACITEHDDGNGDCTTFGNGLDNVDTVVVSADGNNVYTGTLSTDGNSGAIAEFARAPDGTLSQLGNGHDCIQNGDGSSDCAEETGVGIDNVISMAVSPDGENLYSSTAGSHGAIAEFSRAQDGSLAQLPGTNNCIEQLGSGLGCGADDPGLDGAAEVKVSPDGANVYLATSTGGGCCDAAITEFGRSSTDGSLSQLPVPDNCIDEPRAMRPESAATTAARDSAAEGSRSHPTARACTSPARMTSPSSPVRSTRSRSRSAALGAEPSAIKPEPSRARRRARMRMPPTARSRSPPPPPRARHSAAGAARVRGQDRVSSR